MRTTIIIFSIWFLISSTTCPTVYALQTGSVTSNNTQHVHHTHPKLRKYAAVAGIGVLTGGIGGVLLGTGLIHGAVLGAGTHVAFHAAKEKYKKHKQQKTSEQKVTKKNV
jgi:hypothetical protein